MSSPHYKGSTLPRDQFIQHIHDEPNHVRIKPYALDIAWGGDGRYWRITKDIAELVQVSWLEVNGSLEMSYLLPKTKYKLEFKVKLKPDAFGWNDSPVYMMVKPGKKSSYIWKNADLTQMKESNVIPFASRLEFTTSEDIDNDKLTFGLYEIWKGRWKGGLVIEEVVISLAN